MRSLHRRAAYVAMAVALVSLAVAGASAQEEQASAAFGSAVLVSVRFEQAQAVALQDGRSVLDVVVRVALTGYEGSEFPGLDGRLVAFTTAGERVFSPQEVSVVEAVSPSEAVVRLRFERPPAAPYLVVFVGLPAAEQTGQGEAWNGAVFAESDIRT